MIVSVKFPETLSRTLAFKTLAFKTLAFKTLAFKTLAFKTPAFKTLACSVAVSAFALLVFSPAHALTATECSAKYQAAKTAGTLNGQKWNDFRKAECGAAITAAAPAAAPAAVTPAATPPKTADAKPTAAPKPAATPAAAPAPMGNATFPSAVDPKYAKETAGKARMHTCVDQYNANKASNANGGLKWIEKGGGYYSECTKKLKGAA